MKHSVVAKEEGSKFYITVPIDGTNVNRLRKREGSTTLLVSHDTFAEILCVLLEKYAQYEPTLRRLYPLFERIVFEERDLADGKAYEIAISHFFKDNHGSYTLVHVAIQEFVKYLVFEFLDAKNLVVCIPPYDTKFQERIHAAYRAIVPLKSISAA